MKEQSTGSKCNKQEVNGKTNGTSGKWEESGKITFQRTFQIAFYFYMYSRENKKELNASGLETKEINLNGGMATWRENDEKANENE